MPGDAASHAGTSTKTHGTGSGFGTKLSNEQLPGVVDEHEPEDGDGLPKGTKRAAKNIGPATKVVSPGKNAPGAASSPRNEPLAIFTSTDLRDSIGGDPGIGWEPSVASSGNVVFETGNWYAAFSQDSGATFTYVDPFGDLAGTDGGFCCDQQVIYVPSVNLFVWVRQTIEGGNGENRLRLSVATPAELIASNGLTWHSWDITPGFFFAGGHHPGWWFDFPDLAFDSSNLFLSVDLIGSGRAVVWRQPLSALGALGSLGGLYLSEPCGFVRLAQNAGHVEPFGCLTDTSTLRSAAWNDSSGSWGWRDVPISSVATDFDSWIPAGGRQWLGAGSKTAPQIMGATIEYTTQTPQVVYALHAGRDQQFSEPHIDIVRTNLNTLGFVSENYIWNAAHTFVYPDVATNSLGDIAINFTWGGGPRTGGTQWVHSGVGFLNGTSTFVNSSPDGVASGAHYSTLRLSYPDTRRFVAGSFFAPQTSDGTYINHSQFILFGRSSDTP